MPHLAARSTLRRALAAALAEPSTCAKADVAAAIGRCNKRGPNSRSLVTPRHPVRIGWHLKTTTSLTGEKPDELFTTHAAQGIRCLGRIGRTWRADGGAGADGRIHLQICQQS